MGRGIVAFLALLAFVPVALYAMDLHERTLYSAHGAKQALLEQQAIENAGQDFEESFWRVAEYSAKGGRESLKNELRGWAGEMRRRGAEVWYGDTGGPEYPRLLTAEPGGFEPNMKVFNATDGTRRVGVGGGDHDAVIARIARGSGKGVYLITQGCGHEYS
jgi:hypothetical protein